MKRETLIYTGIDLFRPLLNNFVKWLKTGKVKKINFCVKNKFWCLYLHTSINPLFQQHQTSVFCYFKSITKITVFFKQIASPWFNGWKIVMDWKFATEFSVIKILARFIYANFCSINLFSDNPQLKNDLQIKWNWICVGIILLLNEKL